MSFAETSTSNQGLPLLVVGGVRLDRAARPLSLFANFNGKLKGDFLLFCDLLL